MTTLNLHYLEKPHLWQDDGLWWVGVPCSEHARRMKLYSRAFFCKDFRAACALSVEMQTPESRKKFYARIGARNEKAREWATV